jgi:hypothetical protein
MWRTVRVTMLSIKWTGGYIEGGCTVLFQSAG